MRCLTLADELAQQGHKCVFIVGEHPGHLGELIASKGHELHLLPRAEGSVPSANDRCSPYADWLGVSWQYDANQTLKILGQTRVDWLVVDHYALDGRWERQVSSLVGRVMVIDDLADREHSCDLLLDQNLGRKSEDYQQLVSPDCVRLIGPHYAMLRPEFAELRERSLRRRENPELKRLLISLGGVDRENITGKVLSALSVADLPSEVVLDIVMGAAAPHLEEVQRQAAGHHLLASVSVNVTDMAQRMYLADLSIGAAGGTSWERCCLGLPAILVVLADNQIAGARALQESGAAAVIPTEELVPVRLPVLLQQLCEPETAIRMSNCAAAVTAGDGVSKVAQTLTRMVGMYDGRA